MLDQRVTVGHPGDEIADPAGPFGVALGLSGGDPRLLDEPGAPADGIAVAVEGGGTGEEQRFRLPPPGLPARLLLDSAQTVLQLTPNQLELKNLGQKVGVVAVDFEPPAAPLIARSNREARAFVHTEAPSVEVRGSMSIRASPALRIISSSQRFWRS